MSRAAVDDATCRILDWDSAFFGRRIARIESKTLDEARLEAVRELADRESIDCLYLLLDAADVGSRRAAEAGGFRPVDVRVTLERASGREERRDPAIDAYRATDLPVLRALARASHGDSRFYHDPGFPRERCDALYDAWISKACRETPDRVLVARREGQPVGYLACDLDTSEVGSIGLVAVAEEARGHGLGAKLVTAALGWIGAHGRARTRVVTQERNVAAARLYERMGFVTTRVEHWYHLWPRAEASS